jgi:FAD dependent oxidoreductase TIGR03364
LFISGNLKLKIYKSINYNILKKSYDAIVVGAGIVGLSVARALGVRGRKVLVLEKSQFAVGASIRNFGMIWPIGQTEGTMYERAQLSKSIWIDIAKNSGLWFDQVGSLHLAYTDTELEVLSAFTDKFAGNREYSLHDATGVSQLSDAVVLDGLKGGLFSKEEIIVDAPKALALLPKFLNEKYSIDFKWNTAVNSVETGKVFTGQQLINTEEIFVCSGQDFETLYPEIFEKQAMTKCKLQMMKLRSQPDRWRMGPALCGGLSLTHYHGFQHAGDAINQLKKEYEDKYPEYLKWGIHVMASQNQDGEIIIGDSHEYGLTHDPFDRQNINQMILDYLKSFASFPDASISATWNGVYPKMTNGQTECILSPEQGVTIINGLGGAGMTLSFGLAEQVIAGTFNSFVV